MCKHKAVLSQNILHPHSSTNCGNKPLPKRRGEQMKTRQLGSLSFSGHETREHSPKRLFRAFSERPGRRESEASAKEKPVRRRSHYGQQANEKLRRLFGKKHSLNAEQREEEDLALHHRKIRRKIVQHINTVSVSIPALPPELPDYTTSSKPVVVKHTADNSPNRPRQEAPLPQVPATRPYSPVAGVSDAHDALPSCLNWQVFELRPGKHDSRELRRRTV